MLLVFPLEIPYPVLVGSHTNCMVSSLLGALITFQDPDACNLPVEEPASDVYIGDGDNPSDVTVPCDGKGPHWLRLCLEALKEIGAMYMPLKLMQKTGVLKTIMKLRTYPDKCISR